MYCIPKPVVTYVIKNMGRDDVILVGRKKLIAYLARRQYLIPRLCENRKEAEKILAKKYPFRDVFPAYCVQENSWIVELGGTPVLPYTLIQEINELLNNAILVQRYFGSKRRWKFKNYYRSPKTTSEMRDNQEIDEDEPPARKARTSRVLPNSWDDVMRSTYFQHSWKQFRKTQYKVK